MKLPKISIILGMLAIWGESVYPQGPPASAYASLEVPTQIQYQGRITTAAGAAWEGDGFFLFAIYQGDTVIWNNWEGLADSVADPEALESPGSLQVFTLAVKNGLYSLRLGDEGVSAKNKKIPATVFIDKDSGAVRTGLKLAVWFSPDGTWTRKPGVTPGSPTKSANRLSPDVEFTSVPFAVAAGMAETVKKRSVTTEMLAVETAKALNPPGTIITYAGPATDNGNIVEPVPGYLLCNGAIVDNTQENGKYAALITTIQAAWGNGNDPNPATVNLPDLRGRFLRGVSGLTANDPQNASRLSVNSGGNFGNSVGSFQTDATAKKGLELTGSTTFAAAGHQHTSGSLHARIAFGGDLTQLTMQRTEGAPVWIGTHRTNINGSLFGGAQSGSSAVVAGTTDPATAAATVSLGNGDAETRPQNVNVNYLIKY